MNLPDLNPDFQDLIACLAEHRVEFVIVGGYALAFHGVARYTEDIDVFFTRKRENVLRLQLALKEFGVTLSDNEAKELTQPDRFLTFGSSPRAVDLLNKITGIEFDEIYVRSDSVTLGGIDVKILGLEDLVRTKRAVRRPKDLQDLEALRKLHGKLPGDS